MTALSTNIPSTGIFSAIGKVLRSVTSAMQAQRAFTALNSLTDRELADIGMTRQDIPARVAEVLKKA
ncbi:DUF1127 domain-containing protein [Pseudooceanicola algae]|uniref:YjiS-like domain-containing protein n=1 Tax=Pseudooceanicola algae TaxID=1537215 RepID=A0A418SE21_9RHOB|nr:DUF1127 domain-containing protein [Pseudooceanicola algae]QPM89605.1 hypothetical protein PSAL_008260 [Pseudooceanicola algae]